MSLTIRDIMDWQRRFYARPPVWATYHDGAPLNFYDSEEAAKIEVSWHMARHPNRPRSWPRVVRVHLHDLALAQERWGEPRP